MEANFSFPQPQLDIFVSNDIQPKIETETEAETKVEVETDDDESYIEIAIEPKPVKAKNDEEEVMEFQFRISFSSKTTDFPPLLSSKSCVVSSNVSIDKIVESESSLSSTSSSIFSFSSSVNSNLQKMVVNDVEKLWGIEKECAIKTNFNLDHMQSRKSSKMVATINDGISKLMIKFRSVKLESIISFIKRSHKVDIPQHYRVRHDNGMSQRDQLQSKSYVTNNIRNYFANGDKRIGRRKDGKPRRRSCPSSVKSSPIHSGSLVNEESKRHARDDSVLAAIAHCKRSFGLNAHLSD